LSPEPYGGPHYATFPTSLPERCILLSTSEAGVCPSCGAQWARVIAEATYSKHRPSAGNDSRSRGEDSFSIANGTSGWRGNNLLRDATQTLGWRPTCACPPQQAIPATVLDPFCGTGTTLLAAQRLGRRSVGVDLSPTYLALAQQRLEGQTLPLVMAKNDA
jgi:SAM-dependent methyltransferase